MPFGRSGTMGTMASEENGLQTSGARRGARLLSLPLGAAGRVGRGLGRRLRGTSPEQVTELRRSEAADQLFRVLGELKGGAMKVGQQLSLFESVLPEDVAGPYRVQLKRLQDQAPPMPTSRVYQVLDAEFGPRWQALFADFSARPAASASIGQVHKAIWAKTGQPVAVKVQYPGADAALRSDLQQIRRLGGVLAPLAGGMELKPLIDEIIARVGEEIDYEQEAAAQEQAATGFEGHPEFVVPHVLAHTPRVLVSDWLSGRGLRRVEGEPEDVRNEVGLRYVRFLFAGPKEVGLLHADPHPGNFKVLPDGRLGIIDWGLSQRLPDGLPPEMGRLMRLAAEGDAQTVTAGLREVGFLLPRAGTVNPTELLDYLSPFLEPAVAPEFHFTRDWMRQQFTRVMAAKNAPLARQINLPADYLLIHRVWLGGVAVLSQLDVRADFGSVLDESLPCWRQEDR